MTARRRTKAGKGIRAKGSKARATPKKPRGHPTRYKKTLANAYLRRLSMGETGTKICEDLAMPSRTTVWRWAARLPSFAKRLREARVNQAESGFEEIQDIADDLADGRYPMSNEDVNVARVRIDARKFRVSRLNAALYGDTKVHKIGGDPDAPPVKVEAVPTREALAATVGILNEVLAEDDAPESDGVEAGSEDE